MKTSHLWTALCCLGLMTSATQAQREGFETSVIRQADVIILEIQQPSPAGPGPGTMLRKGLSHDGRPAAVQASPKAVTFDNLYFKLDSAELRDETSLFQIAEIAQALKSPKLKDARFLIEGHTCDLGENLHNTRLSAQRAEAIRQLLVRHGIAKERLASLGFGESEIIDPVRADDTPSQAETRRMKSRRVALRLIVAGAPAKY